MARSMAGHYRAGPTWESSLPASRWLGMYRQRASVDLCKKMYYTVGMFHTVLRWALGLCWLAMLVGGAACATDDVGTDMAAHTEIPAEGTCEAAGMLKVANEATFEELDVDAALDKRAAENIVAARPIATLAELDAVGYVGPSALKKILAYAEAQGLLASCGPFQLPDEGTCEADAMLAVANEATFEELDVDAALDKRAAENIIAARPITSLAQLDEVAYVGLSALEKIFTYAEAEGYLATSCAGGEIGFVSDLDKTVVPPAEPDLSLPPYPGVSTLYQILEHRSGGLSGDVYYVTARQPEMVTEIPAYLEDHEVPPGPIETGISGLPWVAEPEKVADVSAILDATADQPFLLFGDSSHRDPAVYQTIIDLYPERIVAAFIHKVNQTVAPHRVERLHLHESYAEVAAILYGYQVITRTEAKSVMVAAAQEGLTITEAEMEGLLDQHAP